jgi:16S rRNA pseudouridine516 synthase
MRGDEVEIFDAGTLLLEGETKPLLPARLDVFSPTEAAVTVTEGRYHQVRRMFAAVGNHVEALHRERMGGLGLSADLAPGDYTVLDAAQVASVLG